MKKFTGFTLAEVLITLGIIGVVAALTLPSVINNYRKQELITRLKKSYTVINQSIKLAEVDNGEFENWYSVDELGRTEYVNRYIKKYFNILKECDTYQSCGYPRANYKALNGSTYRYGTVWKDNGITFAVSDGSIYQFRTRVQTEDAGNEGVYGALVFVDINGSKEPNMLGKDVFMFKRQNAVIRPFGSELSYNEIDANCKKDKTGEYCAAKIMADGWVLKDDYPW